MEKLTIRQTYFAQDISFEKRYFMFTYKSKHGDGVIRVYHSEDVKVPKIIIDKNLKYCTIELGDGVVKVSGGVKMTYTFKIGANTYSCGHLKGDEFCVCLGNTPDQIILINPPQTVVFKRSNNKTLSWVDKKDTAEVYINNVYTINVHILVDGIEVEYYTANIAGVITPTVNDCCSCDDKCRGTSEEKFENNILDGIKRKKTSKEFEEFENTIYDGINRKKTQIKMPTFQEFFFPASNAQEEDKKEAWVVSQSPEEIEEELKKFTKEYELVHGTIDDESDDDLRTSEIVHNKLIETLNEF